MAPRFNVVCESLVPVDCSELLSPLFLFPSPFVRWAITVLADCGRLATKIRRCSRSLRVRQGRREAGKGKTNMALEGRWGERDELMRPQGYSFTAVSGAGAALPRSTQSVVVPPSFVAPTRLTTLTRIDHSFDSRRSQPSLALAPAVCCLCLACGTERNEGKGSKLRSANLAASRPPDAPLRPSFGPSAGSSHHHGHSAVQRRTAVVCTSRSGRTCTHAAGGRARCTLKLRHTIPLHSLTHTSCVCSQKTHLFVRCSPSRHCTRTGCSFLHSHHATEAR